VAWIYEIPLIGLVPDEYEAQHDHNSWYTSAAREMLERSFLAAAKKRSKSASFRLDVKGEQV
jgi:hypothetical protein